MLIATEEKKRPHMIDIKKMESAFIQEVNSLQINTDPRGSIDDISSQRQKAEKSLHTKMTNNDSNVSRNPTRSSQSRARSRVSKKK